MTSRDPVEEDALFQVWRETEKEDAFGCGVESSM
jgi:hypothetical protein